MEEGESQNMASGSSGQNMASGSSGRYVVPTKQVKTPGDIQVWEDSEAYQEYLGFIIAIGEAVKGRKITEEVEMSSCCRRLLAMIKILRENMKLHPPQEIQTRYGNPAYRDWSSRLGESVSHLLGDVLCDTGAEGALVELQHYLTDSFGNSTRIDYGTGHEMAFIMFLCCLFKVGALQEGDRAAVGLHVFAAYMEVSRELQLQYRMEPAGSMGVWNLDDFQFVAFIWGAAQMGDKARLKPKAIPDPEIAAMLARENQFFACLSYIHSVKTGPFHEHSNQLWNISAVPNWTKVFTGLIKMYRAEVLCKFPVIQHSLFGSILSLTKAVSRNPLIPSPSPPSVRLPMPGVDSPRPPLSSISRAQGCLPSPLPMSPSPTPPRHLDDVVKPDPSHV